MNDNPVFTIKVCRCQLCGRLLTNKKSVEAGYSHSCLMKVRKVKEVRRPLDGQMNLFTSESEDKNNG